MNRVKMADFLVELRKEKGLLQQEVAEIFMVTTQAVSKWERGESIPDISILERISEFYGVTIEEILNGERKAKPASEGEKDMGSKPERRKIEIANIVVAGVALLLLLIFSSLGYAAGYIDDFFVSFSLYDLIFKGTGLGNIILLLAFLSMIGATILDILVGAGIKCEGKLGLFRDFLLVGVTGAFFGNIVALYHPEAGAFILLILSVVYLVLTLTLPSYRNARRETISKKGHFLSTYIGIGVVVFALCTPAETTMSLLISYIPLFATLAIIVGGYFAKGKAVEILKLIFTAISAILPFIYAIYGSAGNAFVFGSGALLIYFVVMLAVPVLRIKNLVKE